jgi:hypothetical protein
MITFIQLDFRRGGGGQKPEARSQKPEFRPLTSDLRPLTSSWLGEAAGMAIMAAAVLGLYLVL